MHSVSRESSKPARGTPHAPLTSADVRRIFYGLMLAMFLSALNQTIVATALPTIGRDFGDFENLSWVIIAYLLASTVVSPLYGKLSDIAGYGGADCRPNAARNRRRRNRAAHADHHRRHDYPA